MNVRELMRLLSTLDEDQEVCIAYNYGDYWHTMVAKGVSSVQEEEVVHSAYHNMDKIVEGRDEDNEDDTRETRCVVVLS